MVLKYLFFFKKTIKNRQAAGAFPPDLRLYEMIELQHFVQLATQFRHFSNKKTLISKPPPRAKSWLQAFLWVCRME